MSQNGQANKPLHSISEPQVILSVQVRSDGAMHFESSVPTRDALKLLLNVYTEFLFREFEPKKESSILTPDFGAN